MKKNLISVLGLFSFLFVNPAMSGICVDLSMAGNSMWDQPAVAAYMVPLTVSTVHRELLRRDPLTGYSVFDPLSLSRLKVGDEIVGIYTEDVPEIAKEFASERRYPSIGYLNQAALNKRVRTINGVVADTNKLHLWPNGPYTPMQVGKLLEIRLLPLNVDVSSVELSSLEQTIDFDLLNMYGPGAASRPEDQIIASRQFRHLFVKRKFANSR